MSDGLKAKNYSDATLYMCEVALLTFKVKESCSYFGWSLSRSVFEQEDLATISSCTIICHHQICHEQAARE
jgi:hypothetical protein